MAGNKPSSKFYWNDHASDPALQLCSLAAQGLWMRLLCLAAKAQPYGYVLVSGRSPSLDDLAQLIGRPVPELSPLMEELSEKGVFSRDGKDRIYSRRMLRDSKKSDLARKNGKTGGNPSLCKTKDIQASDKGEVKAWVKAPLNQGFSTLLPPLDPPLLPPAPPSSPPIIPPTPPGTPDLGELGQMVEAVWEASGVDPGPKRVSGYLDDFRRGREWIEAGYTAAEVEAAAKVVLTGKTVRDPWSYLAKVLPDAVASVRAEAARGLAMGAGGDGQPWDQRIAGFVNSRFWMDRWGPEPGRMGCKVPGDVLAKHGLGG